MKIQSLIIISLGLLSSCASKRELFIDGAFSNVDQLKINTVEQFEKKNKSKNITLTHLVRIGEDIYPNKNNYRLETPMVFERPPEGQLQVTVDYYYVLADSSVKVIMYEWDDAPSVKNSAVPSRSNMTQRLARFQSKFDQLHHRLTKILGPPQTQNINQTQVLEGETFRDDVKWQNVNGLNAYLFMLGNNKSGYRRIRLAIYKQ